LYYGECGPPFFPDLHEEYPEQAVCLTKLRARSFSFEDCQLLPQSGILQCDVFVARKKQE
jgi:hypothetical protein